MAQVAVQGNRHGHPANDAEVSAKCCSAPRGEQGGLGPVRQPRPDQGTGGGAVGEDTVYAEVVVLVTVWARVGERVILPKTSIVGIIASRLQPKKPLVPCQSSKFQWIPRGGMKMFMGVLGDRVMG